MNHLKSTYNSRLIVAAYKLGRPDVWDMMLMRKASLFCVVFCLQWLIFVILFSPHIIVLGGGDCYYTQLQMEKLRHCGVSTRSLPVLSMGGVGG